MNGTIATWGQQILPTLLLPPIGLVILALLCGLLAWRGSRSAGLVAALSALGLLLLATPVVAGLLRHSLEGGLADAAAGGPPPAAIVILGGDVEHGPAGAAIGWLTLERLRAGAALQRSTGLPLLVTGGVLGAGDPPLATLMATSLEQDFRTPARWVEPRAADTRENATFSTALLRADGISSAFVVSQGWHLPRALAAFRRAGLTVTPAPVRADRDVAYGLAQWMPHAERLLESWFAIHEWVGRAFYAVRD